MKIKPNYLYRVLGDLEKEGRVKKDGRQYYPAAAELGYHRYFEEAGPFGPASFRWPVRDSRSSPSWLTASRSSCSSITLASIRSREKSGTSRPWTIDHSPPLQVQGTPQMMPSPIP